MINFFKDLLGIDEEPQVHPTHTRIQGGGQLRGISPRGLTLQGSQAIPTVNHLQGNKGGGYLPQGATGNPMPEEAMIGRSLQKNFFTPDRFQPRIQQPHTAAIQRMRGIDAPLNGYSPGWVQPQMPNYQSNGGAIRQWESEELLDPTGVYTL